MSGGASKAIEMQVKETGASAFLRKPFSGKELLEAVNLNLNREDNNRNETTAHRERVLCCSPVRNKERLWQS
jgi:FixJ family two-component response regulator